MPRRVSRRKQLQNKRKRKVRRGKSGKKRESKCGENGKPQNDSKEECTEPDVEPELELESEFGRDPRFEGYEFRKIESYMDRLLTIPLPLLGRRGAVQQFVDSICTNIKQEHVRVAVCCHIGTDQKPDKIGYIASWDQSLADQGLDTIEAEGKLHILGLCKMVIPVPMRIMPDGSKQLPLEEAKVFSMSGSVVSSYHCHLQENGIKIPWDNGNLNGREGNSNDRYRLTGTRVRQKRGKNRRIPRRSA